MNFHTLHIFQVIAESERLSDAARALNISQPALSRTIRTMEEELGFSLFQHKGNSLLLNRNGEEFLEMTRRISMDYRNCLEKIRSANGVHSPLIVISFSSVGNRLPFLTYAFRKRYPESRYSLKNQPYSPRDTTSNFFFLSSCEVMHEKNATLLAREPLFITMSQDHPLARKKSLRLADLKKETFLFPGPDNDMYEIQRHYFQMAGLNFSPENIIDKPNVLVSLIRLNMGITLYPPIRDENLVQIPITDIDCYRNVYFIRNGNLFQSDLAKEFARFTVQFFKKQNPDERV